MVSDKGLSGVNKPSLSQFDSVLNQGGSSSINLADESSFLNHMNNLQEEDRTEKMGLLEAYAKQVGFVEQVPQVKEEEEEGFEAYAKRIEKMMSQGYHGDATEQREIYYLPASDMMMWPNQVQEKEEAGMFGFAGEDGDATGQQQQDTPMFLPLLIGQASELQTMMMMRMQKKYNNAMTMPDQEQYQLDSFGFDGGEDLMFEIYERLNLEDNVTQRHLQQPVSQGQDLRGLAAQVMFTSD